MYDIKSVYEATSVQDAVNALVKDPQAKIIAGGSDVLIQVREGRLAGVSLVSIFGLDELRGVSIEEDSDENGTITIGALTSFTDVAENEIVLKHIPVLAQAVSQVGGPQVRNIGTIGGNVSNGVTSADSGATLLALNATVEIMGADGKKEMPLSDFYISAGKVNLKTGDVVTALKIKKADYEGFSGHYIKYAMRNAMDIATLACCVLCKLDETKNVISDLRISFGTAAPVPMRCKKTEEALIGKQVTRELLSTISKGVTEEINPRTSWRASKEFRLQIASEISKRAFVQAIKNGGGDAHENN